LILFGIIQDDEMDVAEQIACIGDICSGAALLIVATWSDNADSGLPGGPSKAPQCIYRGFSNLISSLLDYIS
jgi:hypothetical protein